MRPEFTQQNGFVHAGIITAGLDNACGIAAFTLMPAGCDILTVEFKTNLLAPARGERFVFRAIVVKPGRTLTICEGRAYAIQDGVETLICDHDRHADGAAAPRAGDGARGRAAWPDIDKRPRRRPDAAVSARTVA